MPFYQGRVNDRNIGRRLKCPFCGEQQQAASNRRNHMRVCKDNPIFDKKGVKV
jgi:hypothetical protein